MKERASVVVRNEEQKSEQEEGKVAQREEELEETGNQHNDVEIEGSRRGRGKGNWYSS